MTLRGVVITGLASFVVAKVTQWINSKVANDKAARYLSTITELAVDSVKEVYQTYVSSLKTEGKFDAEAQKKALDSCLAKIKSKLLPDLKDYIVNNFGDLDEYLKTLIESAIYSLKA